MRPAEWQPAVFRNPVPPLVFFAVVIALGGAYAFFQTAVAPRFAQSRKVLESPSDVRLALRIRYDRGPLLEEDYVLSDTDGLSRSTYKATGRQGLSVTIAERPRRALDPATNVAFLFGRAVQDGIWELDSKPPRGATDAHYTIEVYQFIDGQHGSRSFTFTDPHYWATTGGHQFTLHLDKDKPVPDLVRMSSTTLVDPRYERLVDDIRSFGPASFHAKIAAEKRRRFGVAS